MSTLAISQHVYPNGLVLLAERMPSVRSAACTLLVPAGSAYEPGDRAGTASMLSEWVMRGAGDRDSRELLDALENLGVSHGIGAQAVHTSLTAATLGRNLIPALELFADILRRPRLEEEELEPIRALALQGLQSLEDDPASKVIYELRRRHFPDPWGRPSIGTPEGLEAINASDLRQFQQRLYRPNGAILAVAGALEWEPLKQAVGALLGDWQPQPDPVVAPRATGPHRDHLLKDTQQIQIALAYPTVTITHPDYYLARATATILGGYSSSRLFTEVREKRGLCYSVYAGYESLKDRAALVAYAGTSAERAQETLDVTLAEIDRLVQDGIVAVELEMMRAGLKSSLVMQQESSLGRSSALASDWYHLGRVRSLDEISKALDALTVDEVNQFARAQAVRDMTILTLGPKALTLPA